jgi:putative oxidoreductase
MRRNITFILTIILGISFVGSGLPKLLGIPLMVTQFHDFGYPLWFMYVTGTLEFSGGILTLIPRTTHLGAALIGCVMLGALATLMIHQDASQPPLLIVAIVMLALALAVGTRHGWGRSGSENVAHS